MGSAMYEVEKFTGQNDLEDQALLLLCSLPKTQARLKKTLMFERDSLSLDEVHDALNLKELNERKETNSSGIW